MAKRPLDLRIFQHIRQLGLPDGQYVVAGDSVLVALGKQLEWDGNLAICVRQDEFDAFKNEGWQPETLHGQPVLKNDVYTLSIEFGGWTLDELLEDAVIIRSIPFMSEAKLLAGNKN